MLLGKKILFAHVHIVCSEGHSVGSLENVQEYNVTAAYQIALRTWASWVESSINPRTQKLFFMSLSPTHLWYDEYEEKTNEYGCHLYVPCTFTYLKCY